MSDTSPNSSPDAAASFITPGNPDIIFSVSHPAIAMYFKASADSVALNLVVAPISFALSANLARSFCVAPEIAPTSLIPASKLAPTFTAYPLTAASPAVTAAVALTPITPSLFSPPENPVLSIFVSKTKEPSAIILTSFLALKKHPFGCFYSFTLYLIPLQFF